MTSSLWDRYVAWTAEDIVAMKGAEQGVVQKRVAREILEGGAPATL